MLVKRTLPSMHQPDLNIFFPNICASGLQKCILTLHMGPESTNCNQMFRRWMSHNVETRHRGPPVELVSFKTSFIIEADRAASRRPWWSKKHVFCSIWVNKRRDFLLMQSNLLNPNDEFMEWLKTASFACISLVLALDPFWFGAKEYLGNCEASEGWDAN